ncbi:MAG: biotin--[acetyl-CoA-carboxylase] ligase [Actinobacteria bacterium]|nr:biotin--[acetyl-CoA-carboxylase] ligase [Actinomycetota bacterium]
MEIFFNKEPYIMKYFDKKKFLSICKTRYAGKRLIYFKTLNSTNDYAARLENKALKLKKPLNFFNNVNGCIVISEIQAGGRGRNYKKWFSPSGGLWFTLILVLKIEMHDIKKMNLIMAVSIFEALKNRFGITAKVKWPNDIYYEDKKICGILCELNSFKEISFLNIGTGLNANISFDNAGDKGEELTGNAISIREILKKDIEREELLAEIAENFEINYEEYLNNDLKNIFLKIGNMVSV